MADVMNSGAISQRRYIVMEVHPTGKGKPPGEACVRIFDAFAGKQLWLHTGHSRHLPESRQSLKRIPRSWEPLESNRGKPGALNGESFKRYSDAGGTLTRDMLEAVLLAACEQWRPHHPTAFWMVQNLSKQEGWNGLDGDFIILVARILSQMPSSLTQEQKDIVLKEARMILSLPANKESESQLGHLL